jgi:hypothetical protein
MEHIKNYEMLKKIYSDNFSLGCLNTNMGDKLALISLICHLTQKAKEKKPFVNPYQILMSLTKDYALPEDFIVGLSIVCEDFMYGCKEFPTFGVEEKNVIFTIKNLLKSYLPF